MSSVFGHEEMEKSSASNVLQATKTHQRPIPDKRFTGNPEFVHPDMINLQSFVFMTHPNVSSRSDEQTQGFH